MPTPRRSERGARSRRERSGAAERPGVAARSRAPAAARRGTPRLPERAWLLAIPLALLALLWSCHNALLGTAVGDDYAFLSRLAFQHPLDWLDSMGATFYWRPVSRQLYFSLVGPWLLQAPWLAATLHAALLALQALLLFRIARRFAPAPVAAAVAAFPLVSEPARVLLGWPSGAQHLLAGSAALLAVHEALAGRLATAALAAAIGVLSHESAALALPALPLAAWAGAGGSRAGGSGAARRGVLAAAAVAVPWAAGYGLALGHGIHMPPGGGVGRLVTQLPALYGRALLAALNLEDAAANDRHVLLVLYALIAALGAVVLWRTRRQQLLRAGRPLLVPAAAWFALGVLPLAVLLPVWDAWRAWIPTLGFGVVTTALLGFASPWLAGGWIALKVIALMLSPAAPVWVTAEAPQEASHESFVQIARLQRVVAGTRQALLEQCPTLPPRAIVAYFEIPRLAEYAFQGASALRVWYRDSTLSWDRFGGTAGLLRPYSAGVEYLYSSPQVAVATGPEALKDFRAGVLATNANHFAEADSLLAKAARDFGNRRSKFLGSIIQNRANIAFLRGDYIGADSLNRQAEAIGLDHPDFWAPTAAIALAHGDMDRARRAVRRLLELDPHHPDAKKLSEAVGLEH